MSNLTVRKDHEIPEVNPKEVRLMGLKNAGGTQGDESLAGVLFNNLVSAFEAENFVRKKTSNLYLGLGTDNPYSKLHIGSGKNISTIYHKPGGYTDGHSLLTINAKGSEKTAGIMIGVEDESSRFQRMEIFTYDNVENQGAYGIMTGYNTGARQPFIINNSRSDNPAFKIGYEGSNVYFPFLGVGNARNNGTFLLSATSIGRVVEEQRISFNSASLVTINGEQGTGNFFGIKSQLTNSEGTRAYFSIHNADSRSAFIGFGANLGHDFQIRNEKNGKIEFSNGVGWFFAYSNGKCEVKNTNTGNNDLFQVTGVHSHENHSNFLFKKYECGEKDSRVGLYFQHENIRDTRLWVGDDGAFYSRENNDPSSDTDGDKFIQSSDGVISIEKALSFSAIEPNQAPDKSIFRSSDNNKLSYRDGNNIYEISMSITEVLN